MPAGCARWSYERVLRDERLRQVHLAGVRHRVRHRGTHLHLGRGLAGLRQAGSQAPPGDEHMMARYKRMYMVAGILAGVGLAAWLGTQAFRSNVMFFFDPSQISAGEAPADKRFRLGGMVEKGSVQKTPGTLDIRFLVTDFRHTVAVKYSGILPDLFREGQGVIAHGRMHGDVFQADEILAKHDEKYMPPEVAKALKDNPPPPNVST